MCISILRNVNYSFCYLRVNGEPRKSDRCGVFFYKNLVLNKIIKYSELYFTQYSVYIKFSAQNYNFHFKRGKMDC